MEQQKNFRTENDWTSNNHGAEERLAYNGQTNDNV